MKGTTSLCSCRKLFSLIVVCDFFMMRLIRCKKKKKNVFRGEDDDDDTHAAQIKLECGKGERKELMIYLVSICL